MRIVVLDACLFSDSLAPVSQSGRVNEIAELVAEDVWVVKILSAA
jgi:hypothetical protein